MDDFVSSVRGPSNETIYRCSRAKKHGDDPYLWTVDEAGRDRRYPEEGLAAELDLFTALRACFDEEATWIEYGVLEDRFMKRSPDKYKTLRGIYGSTLLDGARRYSVASYVTRHVLSKLEQWGELSYKELPATGKWTYTGNISYWTTVPPPVNDVVLTFEQYSGEQGAEAADEGRD